MARWEEEEDGDDWNPPRPLGKKARDEAMKFEPDVPLFDEEARLFEVEGRKEGGRAC